MTDPALAPAAAAPPEIVLVAAVAANGVIGRDNALCWHIPADLRHFRALTLGHAVVMGRRTFESIGRPLPGRHNIVLTRSADWTAAGVTVARTISEAIAAAGTAGGAIMVIGGGAVFRDWLPLADRIELTEVDVAPEGDVRMPPVDYGQWTETARQDHPAADTPAFRFLTLVRSKPLAAGAACR
jgi:dihydrofolate reductase